MTTDYKPISCDFHSVLEHYATLKEVVEFELASKEVFSSTIQDIITRKGEEFILFDCKEIRLDKIVRINDVKLEGGCNL